MCLSSLQSAGLNPDAGAAHSEGRGESGHEGAAGSCHLQHHAGHALGRRNTCTLCTSGLPSPAGQHTAVTTAGPAQ